MSSPSFIALNPSQVARDFIVEMRVAGTTGAYQPLTLKNVDLTGDDANMEAENRYSDGGYARSNKTGTGWNVTATVPIATLASDATTYDAATVYLLNTIEGALGTAALVDIRFYEWNTSAASPRVYARQGLATAAIKLNFGDPTANRDATLTFTGQGALNKITHPYPLAAIAPVINSITPGSGTTFAAAGGTTFRMLGNHFTGVTTVTFGGTAATSFVIWSDGEITGVAPAKTAGAVNVVATNPAGASAAFAVTYV
jgi:hypothetical protein